MLKYYEGAKNLNVFEILYNIFIFLCENSSETELTL